MLRFLKSRYRKLLRQLWPLKDQFRYYPELGKGTGWKDTFLVSRISEAILLRSMVNYRESAFARRLQIEAPQAISDSTSILPDLEHCRCCSIGQARQCRDQQLACNSEYRWPLCLRVLLSESWILRTGTILGLLRRYVCKLWRWSGRMPLLHHKFRRVPLCNTDQYFEARHR